MNEKKEISLAIEKPKSAEPTDTYSVVFILFALVGIVHSMPLTFFTTANDYWMYKFRNTLYDEADSSHRTNLQTEFSPSVTISTHIAGISFSFLNLFFGHKLSSYLRLLGSLVGVTFFYVIAALFIHVDTDSWQVGFFVLTMLQVAGLNAMTTTFGLTFFSIISKFPKEFLKPYLNGQGIGSVFTAALQILALAIGISTTKSALVYFWIAIGMVLCGLLYMILVMKYNKFFNYYNDKEDHRMRRKTMSLSEIFSTLKLIWKSIAILIFFLWVFNPMHPAITSLVVSEGEGNGTWNDVYFVPVITFGLYACGDYIGRIIFLRLKFFMNIDGIWWVLFSAIRIVIFIPLIMFCNAQPRTHLSVVFSHDYQYILIITAFAMSSGFLLTAGQMLISVTMPPKQLEDGYHINLVIASVMMGTFSFLGFISVDLL